MNLLKEIKAQFNLKEWVQAIFCYIPTASGVIPKAGATLTQRGQNCSFNDFHNHLINWRKEVQNG